MKLCYVDETGTDGRSPALVMVGIIADAQRLHRTQREFADLLADLGNLVKQGAEEATGIKLRRTL